MAFQATKYYARTSLGSRQNSKKRYRKSRGRHNKTRQKWRGRAVRVEIGFRNNNATQGLVMNKVPIMAYNAADLANVTKENIIIVGSVGDKNKLEIAREIEKRGLLSANLNTRKFIKQMERRMKKKDNKHVESQSKEIEVKKNPSSLGTESKTGEIKK